MVDTIVTVVLLVAIVALVLLALFTRVQASLELEVDEGEARVYEARRHWVVLLQRAFVFVVIAFLATAIALYRGVGGKFIQPDIGQRGNFDLVNLLLTGLIVILLILRIRARRKSKKPLPLTINIPYLLAIGALALAIFFRYNGGRFFYVEPRSAPGFDLINLLLVLVVVLMAAIIAFVYIDWRNDFLILTTTRVYFEDRVEIPFIGELLTGRPLIIRQNIQQMLIEDIQQVAMRRDSYIEPLLHRLFGRFGFERYGTLVLRSRSPQRLMFSDAANPEIMQRKIQSELNTIRQQEKPELLLRRMIESEVYGKQLSTRPKRRHQVKQRQIKLLAWLFEPNPEIDEERKTIMWRPALIYTITTMLRPIGLLILVFVISALLGGFQLLPVGWALLVWGVPTVIGLGWVWWIYEEHEHDRYILTPKDITDIDKKPFGPEHRRQATLNAIQDISYDYGFVENLLGYGTVHVETGGASGGRFSFEHVPDPRDVQATINDYLTEFHRNEREGQLRNTVALLKEYHAIQIQQGEVLNEERYEEIARRLVAQIPENDVQTQVAQEVASQLSVYRRREARLAELIRLFRWRSRRRSSS